MPPRNQVDRRRRQALDIPRIPSEHALELRGRNRSPGPLAPFLLGDGDELSAKSEAHLSLPFGCVDRTFGALDLHAASIAKALEVPPPVTTSGAPPGGASNSEGYA
jgi:hypothetical protein